jgi:hypothetical protein
MLRPRSFRLTGFADNPFCLVDDVEWFHRHLDVRSGSENLTE